MLNLIEIYSYLLIYFLFLNLKINFNLNILRQTFELEHVIQVKKL